MSNIVIDTTQAATDTIDYVGTDQSGLTSTSTRTVIILPAQAGEQAAAPPITPTDDAATSTSSQSQQGTATSTAQ